jgi:hypothetical protein
MNEVMANHLSLSFALNADARKLALWKRRAGQGKHTHFDMSSQPCRKSVAWFTVER